MQFKDVSTKLRDILINSSPKEKQLKKGYVQVLFGKSVCHDKTLPVQTASSPAHVESDRHIPVRFPEVCLDPALHVKETESPICLPSSLVLLEFAGARGPGQVGSEGR